MLSVTPGRPADQLADEFQFPELVDASQVFETADTSLRPINNAIHRASAFLVIWIRLANWIMDVFIMSNICLLFV